MLKGKGVSSGIAFGNVIILKNQKRDISKRVVEDVEKELNRFKNAYNVVIKETEDIIKKLSGTELEIMQAYLMIMQDPSLTEETENLINNLKYNAEYSVEEGFNKVIQIFENMDDEYMAGRAKDIEDIKNRVLAQLSNEKSVNLSELKHNTIIVATELTTSDTAKLDFSNVSGIITEIGGVNSHTSIMARTHAIPAITKLENATNILKNGDSVAINGETGEIYLNPTEQEKQNLIELEKQK